MLLACSVQGRCYRCNGKSKKTPEQFACLAHSKAGNFNGNLDGMARDGKPVFKGTSEHVDIIVSYELLQADLGQNAALVLS